MPIVTVNGEEHEVELDAITFKDDETPTGFVPTAKLASEVQRRVASAKQNARNDLLSDDEFVAEVFTSKGIELREDGTIKGGPKDAAQLEAQFMAKHVQPLKTQLEEAQSLVNTLRGKTLTSTILEAAREAKVRSGLLNDGPLSITKLVADKFEFDPETGQYGLKDGDNWKYASGGQLAGAKELFAELKADPNYADLFESGSMKGAGLQGTDTNSNKTYTRAEIQSMDPDTYEAQAEDIRKAYAEGRISE